MGSGRSAWFFLVPNPGAASRFFQVFRKRLTVPPLFLGPVDFHHTFGSCSEASCHLQGVQFQENFWQGPLSMEESLVHLFLFSSLSLSLFLCLSPLFPPCLTPCQESQGPEYLFICFPSYILRVFSQLLGTMTGGLESRSLALSQEEFPAEPTNEQCGLHALHPSYIPFP